MPLRPIDPVDSRASGTNGELEGVFVGRERELRELDLALDAAAAGRGRLVLIAGEPGIGKTHLAAEVAARAFRRGVTALWGRCWEGGGAPAYWPWVQVIRSHVRTSERADVVAQMGGGAPLIAEVAPEIRRLFPDLPVATHAADSEEARFRLFDATASFLRSVSVAGALLVVLDDLQWADEPSLLLLRFLVRSLSDAGVLFLGSYRDVEAKLVAGVAERIRSLESEALVIALRGLAPRDVGEIARARCSALADDANAAGIHRATGGNPLFVGELLRLFDAEGRLERPQGISGLPIPDRVREVIRRRARLISEDCRQILCTASVAGRDLRLALLQEVCGIPVERLLELLSEARGAGLLVEVSPASGRFSFAHDLIRDALYDGLPYGERIRLHRRIAETLEQLHQAELDVHAAELAYHFLRASPSGTAEQAVRYSSRAAVRAARQLAYEESAVHYERALEASAAADSSDERRTCRLWLALGEARWWAGRLRDSKAAYRSAAEVADRLGARHELAQAAFGLAGRGNFGYGTPDEELVRVLERALEGLAEKDGALRAMLMSRLAVALASSPARERAAELAQAAIDMARRVGDKPALQFVLNAALHATWGPDDLAGRLEMSREIAHLGNEIGGAALVSGGNSPLHFLEAGDVAAAERETERRTAHTLRCRFCASWFEFGRARSALFEGRFDEVEGLNARVLAARRELQDEDSADSVLAQLVLLRREEGRLAEILPDVDGLAERYRALPFWRAALGWIYAELGREADARRELERLALADFAALRRDRDWLPCLAMLAEVVATLADVRRAGELYSLLLPYAERCIVSFGLSFGSAARSLGCLATTRGELGDAVRHFDDALAANARLGSPPWVAHTEYAYARTLLLRDESDDRARALELLGRAARTARELGMRALLGRIETLDLAVAEPRARGPRLPLAVETSVFRREGEYWTIAHAGTTIRIKDAKGLRYLALLLRHPEREFPALELVREASIPSGCFDPGPAADSGPILDDTSIEAYRRRLADLREELSEAEALADLGRTEKARAEIDALARALTSAVGLGGRRRRAGAAAERARLVVTKAIKASLRKIERGHPPLGRLLAAAIRTGTCCAYRPEPDRPVTWRF